MHSSKRLSAQPRTTTPLVGKAMFALLATAVMVAVVSGGASETSLHGAAADSRPSVKTVVVKPRHAAPKLLPVVDHDDIKPEDRILADAVLRALPSHCRDNLQNFYVNYDKNAANRGLGGPHTMIIKKTPPQELMALIVHECGHVTDLGGLKGTTAGGLTDFFDGNTPIYGDDPSIAFYEISWVSSVANQPNAKESHFVSGYGASDPFEDFAETFAMYALQKTAFQKLAAKNPVLKAKYDYMEKVVFRDTPTLTTSKHVPGKKVPWDVTKLPYVWHAKR